MKNTKVIILLAAVTLLLAACTKASTPPANEDVVENSTATEIAKNSDATKSYEDIIAQCESNSDPIQQAGCYWTTAFTEMDQLICDFIPTKSEEEIKAAIKAAGQDYEDYYIHLTPQRCRSEFAYNYEGVNWAIESGIPPYPELMNVYAGEATLTGWIVYTPAYVGEPEAHFRVADADIKKLPPSLQKHQNYLLLEPGTEVKDWQRLNENTIKELETATESDPATILVDRAVIVSEGSPTFRLVEIVKD